MSRGCGSRVQGDVYATLPLGPDGSPVEDYLFDPPIPLDAEAMGVKPRGVAFTQAPDGTTHVLDWIGADSYPNATDFIEEVRHMGMSRKIPKNMDFSRLTSRSRLMVLHPRGYIENWLEYWNVAGEVVSGCPKHKGHHKTSESLRESKGSYVGTGFHRDWIWLASGNPTPPAELEHCIGLLYGAVTGGDVIYSNGIGGEPHPTRDVVRYMPSFSYRALQSPPGLKPEFRLALIASFPIAQLDVIQAEDGSHDHGYSVATASGLPVTVQAE